MTTGDRLSLVAIGILVGAAVAKEFSQPEAERTGHGRVWGVPYDLRKPTIQRVRQAWWDPSTQKVLTPRAFGIGWTINMSAINRLVRR